MAKKIKIELDYDIGDSVYLKTDIEYMERIVIEIRLLSNNLATYIVACGAEEPTEHYPIELADTKPTIN